MPTARNHTLRPAGSEQTRDLPRWRPVAPELRPGGCSLPAYARLLAPLPQGERRGKHVVPLSLSPGKNSPATSLARGPPLSCPTLERSERQGSSPRVATSRARRPPPPPSSCQGRQGRVGWPERQATALQMITCAMLPVRSEARSARCSDSLWVKGTASPLISRVPMWIVKLRCCRCRRRRSCSCRCRCRCRASLRRAPRGTFDCCAASLIGTRLHGSICQCDSSGLLHCRVGVSGQSSNGTPPASTPAMWDKVFGNT